MEPPRPLAKTHGNIFFHAQEIRFLRQPAGIISELKFPAEVACMVLLLCLAINKKEPFILESWREQGRGEQRKEGKTQNATIF